MRTIKQREAEAELKQLRRDQETFYIIDFYNKDSGVYSLRKEIGAVDIKEATEKAITFIPEVEAEIGPVDRVNIINCHNLGNKIFWKKLRSGFIAKLLVPANARRISTDINGYWNHIKCEYVKVLNIYDGETEVSEGYSISDPNLKFKKGETVYPNGYIHDCRREPSPGIYCCYTREQAEAYQVNPPQS